VSGSDFRQITLGGDAPKRERLFRAAVSAFCSLTRPSRRDISQLEDLTLPLFDGVSPESRRYVAAALSECRYPPPNLVKRLCDEPLEVAAPLLIRSTALADIDLLALIGRHGAGHARAIGRRPRLNPTIADLVAVIERKSREAGRQPGKTGAARGGDGTKGVGRPAPDVDSARRRLRSMMLPAGTGPAAGPPPRHRAIFGCARRRSAAIPPFSTRLSPMRSASITRQSAGWPARPPPPGS
jgi:hypothetical protein